MSMVIFSPYFPPHVGGVEAYVDEFLTVCTPRRAGGPITVVTTRLPPEAPVFETTKAGVAVWRLPSVEAIPNFPVPQIWSPRLWRVLRRALSRRPTVIVTHTRFFTTTLLGWAVARRTGARWVHVEHGSDFVQLGSRPAAFVAWAYDHTLGRLVLRRADVCVAISRAAAGFASELSGRAPTVLYRGVDVARLASARPDRELARLAGGRPKIAYVGRLIDGKGVADLLEALARMEGERPFCALVGDGPRRADLERLARARGLDADVRFYGYLPEDEALGIILAADILVNPSYTEGLPTAVLLAALCGRAVLATDVGGTREVIEHERSGLLLPPRDVDRLAADLARLVGDPALRERLGSAARADAASRFDWEPTVTAFLELARLSAPAAAAPPSPPPAPAAHRSEDPDPRS